MSHFIYCYVECRFAESHYAECRYDECRGAVLSNIQDDEGQSQNKNMTNELFFWFIVLRRLSFTTFYIKNEKSNYVKFAWYDWTGNSFNLHKIRASVTLKRNEAVTVSHYWPGLLFVVKPRVEPNLELYKGSTWVAYGLIKNSLESRINPSLLLKSFWQDKKNN